MYNLLRDREFSQIMSNHLGLNFNLVEFLSRVDTNNATDHFRHNNHISEMGLDQIRLLVGLGFLLRFAKLLDQTHRLTLESSVEPTTGTSVDDIAELIGGEIEKSDEYRVSLKDPL
jgi:hypothetical protein